MSKPKTTAAKKTTAAASPKPAKDRPSAAAVASEADEKMTYQERMRKMKPHERVRTKLDSTVERFEFIVEEVESWKNTDPKNPGELAPEVKAIVDAAKQALTAIEEVTDLVKSLPKGFEALKPRKTPTSSLEEGTKVNLRDKFAETYAGIIDGKDRKDLEVVGIRKGRVVCKTVSGEKVLLPRGHVEVSNEPEPKAKTKAA